MREAKQWSWAAQRGKMFMRRRLLGPWAMRRVWESSKVGTPGVYPSARALPGAAVAGTTFLLRKGSSGMLRVRTWMGADICLGMLLSCP